MSMNFTEGEILLVDKPLEWTSFDVVKKLKWLIQKKEGKRKIKVGHAGTLDPLASGLLILCTGKKTKEISVIQAQEKEYTGEIFLGATTPTYDLESEPENFVELKDIDRTKIEEATKAFIGEIDQMPPIFSAKKVKGVRAYELARRGKEVDLQPNRVEIKEFEITKIELPVLEFKVRCSKGTYIRSLAHDLGEKLESGAYLKNLRRTKIGDFHVEKAKNIDQWVSSLQP